jgi:hypothetical protein
MKLFYYDVLAEFKRQFYQSLLTSENVKSSQIHISKFHYSDGAVNEDVNFWGYELEKDGIKYLLSSTNSHDEEISLTRILPIRPTKTEKVSYKGVVYLNILGYTSARIKPEQTMSFRDMVNMLCDFQHTNPIHQRLMWFIVISQMFERCNFRVSTPPGFGKDSAVDIIGNLLGKAGTIENPTIAKLEERASCMKLLALNEVVDITSTNWRQIEQFLLSAGAFKPVITKRSKAHGTVGEVIDISQLSLMLMYNDIDCYPKDTEYFDTVTKHAVKDRFVPLRLHGRFNEDFNTIKSIDVKTYVADNYNTFIVVLRNLEYHKNNLHLSYHDYVYNIPKMSPRWEQNIAKLLYIIDCYSEDQQEFTRWVSIVLAALEDYQQMLDYNLMKEALEKKSSQKDMKDHIVALSKMDTFMAKNTYIRHSLKNPNAGMNTQNFWG